MSTPTEARRVTAASLADLPGHDHLGHLLWESSARALELAESSMSELPLSPPSVGALGGIAEFPGITASELARHAFKTQQAASQITGRLERLGYIERRVGAGRGVGLHITAAGRRALEQGLAAEREVDQRLEDLLGPESTQQLHALLQQLRARLIETAGER